MCQTTRSRDYGLGELATVTEKTTSTVWEGQLGGGRSLQWCSRLEEFQDHSWSRTAEFVSQNVDQKQLKGE